jgi:metal-responsive CopG/Arc/MetJ family transcriptional regulator
MYNSYIMKTSISLTRTQIYLTQQQQQRLSDVSRQSSVTKSELIRLAVNQFLDQKTAHSPKSRSQKLAGLVGLWTDRVDMADPGAYVQALRQPRF